MTIIINNDVYDFKYTIQATGEVKKCGEKKETIELNTLSNTLRIKGETKVQEHDIQGYRVVRATDEGEYFSVRARTILCADKAIKEALRRCKKYPDEMYGVFAVSENNSFLILRFILVGDVVEAYSKDKLLFSSIKGEIQKDDEYLTSKLDEIFPLLK